MRRLILVLFSVFSLAAFSLSALSLSAMAESAADIGPAVGAALPHALTAQDQEGTSQSYTSLVGEKGAVLVFYRSADWCPFCQMQLIDLNLHAKEKAAALGYTLIGISYDPVADLAKFSKKWSIGFPLLSDEGSHIIDAFGIRNDSRYKEGDRAWGVPYPMLVITDTNGTVQAKLMRESYRERPEPEVLLETLGALAAR